jgi:integrase/recombinase XerC
MNFSDIVDTTAVPPTRLPGRLDDAIEYLTSAMNCPVYVRWTPATLARRYGSMKTAKAEQPDVFALLVGCTAVIQFWQLGQIVAMPEDQAPSPGVIVERLLRTLRVRFRPINPATLHHAAPCEEDETGPRAHAASSRQAIEEDVWLKRAGRFFNQDAVTNSLAVSTDAAAVAAFLKDRASRSPHTHRAYSTDIQRLIDWCKAHGIQGPLSDLTRVELIRFRENLSGTLGTPDFTGRTLGRRSSIRAMAVVQSLYVYLLRTGYIRVNPAAELGKTSTGRATYKPTRILPRTALNACDRWLQKTASERTPTVVVLRRVAIVALYRWSGVRVDELAHRDGYPRIRIDEDGWTLEVLGKGRKLREVPLPRLCIPFIERYRLALGLPAAPTPLEKLPLIRGSRGGSLGRSGLYRQVKIALQEMSLTLDATDSAARIALESASPHWLRHSYARTLVVDEQAPLPVVQTLLGHVSVQTTASYASTDLSQARHFVEEGFPSA